MLKGHTNKVAALSSGYFIKDIRENDFSLILLYFGVKMTNICMIIRRIYLELVLKYPEV